MRAVVTKGLGASALVLLASTSALAQSASLDESSAAVGGGIEEITVTAQRRAQNLQDVPIAVSAFSANELQTRQITRTIDLLPYVPNLQGHNNTGVGTANTYSLRGLQNSESIATFDPPVGTYVDDIYISRQNANNFSFFDIERIEVLRGPQGTLFGRNTVGGAINIILKKPAETIGGFAEIGYGKYNRIQTRASVDLPIIPGRILSKFSAYYIDDDGYVKNQTTGERLNDENSWGLRGALRFLFSDSVTWDVAADYASSDYSNLVHFIRKDKSRIAFSRLRSDTPLGSAIVSSRLADNTLGNYTDSYSFSSNFEVDAGDVTLNFITGYRHLFQEFATDSADSLNAATVVYDGFYLASNPAPGTSTILANDGYHKQFSQEVKITGKLFDGMLDYVGGFYYLNERNKTIFANVNVPVAGVRAANVTQDRTMTNTTEAYAGYLQLDAHVTPALTVTAGIRYTDERKDIGFSPNANPLPRSGALNQPFDTQDLIDAGIPIVQRSRVWTPRFAIDYKFSDDVMVFASATKGFKSGGWNARANYAALAVDFSRETVWSYEGGVRSELFDRHLRVNLTGFYYIDKDFQLPAGYFDTITGQIVYLTRNFADLENYGAEAEVTVVPVENLNIFWSMGLQDPKYKNLSQPVLDQIERCRTLGQNCNTGIVTPTGGVAQPTRAPKFSQTLGANYTFEFGGDYELTPNVAWQYVGNNWVSTSNAPAAYQRKHSVFNGGVTLRNVSDGWSITAECTNCFNRAYNTSFLIYSYLSEPGRWMIRARKDF